MRGHVRVRHGGAEAPRGKRRPLRQKPDYGEPYYGCFIRDLNGHKIEAAYWGMELVRKLYLDR